MPRKTEDLQYVQEELLSPKEAEYMRLRKNGWTYQKIADKYGVSRQCVHQAVSRGKNRTLASPQGPGRPKDPKVQKIKAEELSRKLEKREAQRNRLERELGYVHSRIELLTHQLTQAREVVDKHWGQDKKECP